jgi:hypothetical protein
MKFFSSWSIKKTPTVDRIEGLQHAIIATWNTAAQTTLWKRTRKHETGMFCKLQSSDTYERPDSQLTVFQFTVH